MIFFKNLFLLLILSVALFSQESTIVSQEIISTDSPEELIGNEVDTYEPLNSIEEQSTYTNLPMAKVIPLHEEPTPSSQPKEQIVPTPNKTKSNLNKTFSEAVSQAKQKHKIILLEVYGTNCPYCKKMEKETFTQNSVINELENNFILVRINGDEEKIPLNIKKQMTPMHVFVTEYEDVKDMTFGFLNEKDFLELLDKEKN